MWLLPPTDSCFVNREVLCLQDIVKQHCNVFTICIHIDLFKGYNQSVCASSAVSESLPNICSLKTWWVTGGGVTLGWG